MYSSVIKIFLISLLFALTSGLANAQESCPKVGIIGPAGFTTPGDVANFTVGSDLLKIEGLKFTWTVSSGTIESRQGETYLAVRTGTDTAFSSITVSLEVSGLAEGCSDTVHETVGIAPICVMPPLIDQWERISHNDERGRLDVVLASWEQRKMRL